MKDPKEQGWSPLDPVALIDRLRKVQHLLRTAAAVGLAQDSAKLERMVDLEQRIRKAEHGAQHKRRYR